MLEAPRPFPVPPAPGPCFAIAVLRLCLELVQSSPSLFFSVSCVTRCSKDQLPRDGPQQTGL